MSLQKPGSREGLVTHMALVLEVMSEEVHGESWHADIHFATMLTFLRLLTVQTPLSFGVEVSIYYLIKYIKIENNVLTQIFYL